MQNIFALPLSQSVKRTKLKARMDFEEIKKAAGETQIETLRSSSDDNFEAVIVKAQVSKLVTRLEDFFGPPAFPSKDKLSSEISRAIDTSGGIMPGQTLYYHNYGDYIIFAMLWPWGDGERITVKIIKKVEVKK